MANTCMIEILDDIVMIFVYSPSLNKTSTAPGHLHFHGATTSDSISKLSFLAAKIEKGSGERGHKAFRDNAERKREGESCFAGSKC